ncbi:oleosin H2 [Vitis vinifera]|uniref:oleosin H2 n=1 Tax=Vitis vinifera TaxID=29760 RepID=UPI0001984BAF|nr:oleosin H2 [Vitis vinifera]
MQTTCHHLRQHLSPLFLSPSSLYLPLLHRSPSPNPFLSVSVQIIMAERDEQKGPSASKILAVIALLPLGGTLLLLSGLTFVGSMVGLAVATPLFLLFSPVLVPAAIGIGLAVTGFLSSGALGVTALSSLSWFLNYLRQLAAGMPDYFQRVTDKLGRETKEMGQELQSQAHEGWGKPTKRIQIGL